MKATSWTVAAVALCAVTGCAAAPPSKQLVDARTIVGQASNGRAAKYAPDDLLAAKYLLGKAEKVSNGSPEEVQYAYLADREGRRAESRGDSLYYAEQQKDAVLEYTALQETGRLSAQENLDHTRRELEQVEAKLHEKDADVDALTSNKKALEAHQARLVSSLTTTNDALAASEKARADAETRATSAIASLTALGNLREEATRTVLTLSGSVLFKTGEATLLPLAQDSLARIAEALRDVPEARRIVVQGHTDSQGNDASNQRLSQDRAQAVLNYLTSQGVPAGRLSAIGQGEAQPVASNETAEGRANNRRVELIIEKGAATTSPQASR